jgi:hypothetical protein
MELSDPNQVSLAEALPHALEKTLPEYYGVPTNKY